MTGSSLPAAHNGASISIRVNVRELNTTGFPFKDFGVKIPCSIREIKGKGEETEMAVLSELPQAEAPADYKQGQYFSPQTVIYRTATLDKEPAVNLKELPRTNEIEKSRQKVIGRHLYHACPWFIAAISS